MKAWPRRTIRLQRGFALFFSALSAAMLSVMAGPAWALLSVPIGTAYYRFTTRKYRARVRLLDEPMPDGWRELLDARVAFYRRLPLDQKRRFEDNVRIFVSEQRIVSVHGAHVDDEVRLLIGASAAMLCHNWPSWEWDNLRDILVYPRSFDEEYSVERQSHLSGMVHSQGPIILSLKDLRLGFAHPKDGHNVALHELAHVLDMAQGYADGVPAGLDWVAEAPWVQVIADRLAKIRNPDIEHVLRDYAGVDEAELFAVVVEVFFEQPVRLRRHDPELYAMLAAYFEQDPASEESSAAEAGHERSEGGAGS
jgi:MtfA peptidase